MSQRCRRDDGWVSVELAIVTPVLLFLVCAFITLLSVAAQRVNFTAALRDCAVAAARWEAPDAIAERAVAQLPGLDAVTVVVDEAPQRGPDLGQEQVTVTLRAQVPMPRPFAFVRLHWTDAVVVPVGA